jgi:predicted acylesterase/phospholipase RssA/CRP-like cAMP-binding protein
VSSIEGDILGVLERRQPFGVLDPDRTARLGSAARLVTLEAGEDLVRRGDESDVLYVVDRGQVAVLTGTGPRGANPDGTGPGRPHGAPVDVDGSGTAAGRLTTLGPGTVIGEIAVLRGGPRSATLRATEPTVAVAIEGASVRELLADEPEVARQLARTASDRLVVTRLADHLHRLFPGTDDSWAAEVVAAAQLRTLSPGEVLVHQGDPADSAFVVVTGRLRARIEVDGEIVRPLEEVGSGSLVGERALLRDGRRSATLVAARSTTVAAIPRDRFEALTQARPNVVLNVMRTMFERDEDARRRYRRARGTSLTLAILAVSPTADPDTFAAELFASLQARRDVVRLRRDDATALTDGPDGADAGAGDLDGLRLDRWLDEEELGHDTLLLVADDRDSGWTRRCIDRADHIVLLARAADDPEPGALERSLIAHDDPFEHQRISLVLQHPADLDRPTDTHAWLAPRRVEHYHVRDGAQADLDRAGRHLTGDATWLVLGGGGAKGFAHLGVVRAMRELQLPIDGVVGSSMGTTMAGLLAIEVPDDELVPRTRELFRRILDYTVPVSGLIAARRIVRSIETAVDGRDLEDTWLPMRCVSTNLTRSRVKVHTTGDLARATRASLSIPGVMPAVADGDDLLVDGGVMNNLPIDVARREAPTGTVIAVDVAPVMGPRAKGDHGLYVRGGRVMMARMTPGLKPPRVPRMMPTLMRSLLASAAQSRDAMIADGLADLVLSMELRGVGLLAFDVVDPVVEFGYEESIDALSAFAVTQSAQENGANPHRA